MPEKFEGTPPEEIKIGPRELENEKEQQEQEVREVNFADLKRGDILIIETLLGETIGKFEITVIGKRKDGLLVRVKEEYGKEQREEFTARMPGGFTMHREEGLTPGILKVETEKEKNCLYFENLKDIKTQERISSSMRTTPIQRVVLIKQVKKGKK